MSSTDSTDPIDRYLEHIETGTMPRCETLSPGVVLDATVPNWRFTVRGDAAVRDELSRWYASPGSFEELKRNSIPTGQLVEFTLRWEEAGIPHAAHQAHIITVAHGQITRDQAWCGGRWPESLLADMAAAGGD